VTVGDLIKELQKYSPLATVMADFDEEGDPYEIETVEPAERVLVVYLS
jgi:hypothetical protein